MKESSPAVIWKGGEGKGVKEEDLNRGGISN